MGAGGFRLRRRTIGLRGVFDQTVQGEGNERVSETCDVEFGKPFTDNANFLGGFVNSEPFRWLRLQKAAELAKTRMSVASVVKAIADATVRNAANRSS